jgi:hypothetical protein
MKTFREFLRQRRPKTSASKGAEESDHDNPDLIRVDDWSVRLRWRTRERVRLVHQLEAK